MRAPSLASLADEQQPQRLACTLCDGTGHRCDYCDGNGWLYADELPEHPNNPRAEIFDARH